MARGEASLPVMQLTIEIPDELAHRLQPERDHVAEIIERGLRPDWLRGSALAQEVVGFLARGPRPAEILAFRPSQASLKRVRELLDKNREGKLVPEEVAELSEVSALNHLFVLIKAQARQFTQAVS